MIRTRQLPPQRVGRRGADPRPRGAWGKARAAAVGAGLAVGAFALPASAAEEPLPWSRGTLAPGAAVRVGPAPQVTRLVFGVGLDYFVAKGFSFGLSLTDELLIYSNSVRGRLPAVEKQLPTNLLYLIPSLRWAFFRRFRFSPYVYTGIGPAFFNNGGGVYGHWEAGPGAYIGLVGGLFLDLGVVFSGGFPGGKCNSAFVYQPPDAMAEPVQLTDCAFTWAPKIGLAYAFGFGTARRRAQQRRAAESRGAQPPAR